MKKYRRLIFLIAAFIMLVVFSPVLSYELFEIAASPAKTTERTVKIFIPPPIIASSSAVYDITTGKMIYAKDAEDPRPLASLAKLMTSFTAYDTASTAPDQIVTITKDAIAAEGDTGLIDGEEWHLKDLIRFTLIASSNDGAYAIADHFGLGGDRNQFVAQMNAKAQALGLKSLHFNDPAGLDNADETVPGAAGSASDIARLGATIYQTYPDLLEGTGESSVKILSADGRVHIAKNTDIELSLIPHVLGGKTGFTDLAGGNLLVIVNVGIDHPVVLVVLGSTYDARFSDMNQLASSTMAYFGSE